MESDYFNNLLISTKSAYFTKIYQNVYSTEIHLAYKYIPTSAGHGLEVNENGDHEHNWANGDAIFQELLDVQLKISPTLTLMMISKACK